MFNKDYRLSMVPIVPQHYLHFIENAKHQMALAHLVGAPGMEAYTEFYTNCDGYVILDNGVIENSQVTIEELVEKANIIDAHEIILPDVYKDAKATYRKVKESIQWLESHDHKNFKIHVVPQGSSMDEWVKCAVMLIRNFGMAIDTIGVPKHLIDTCKNRDARLIAIKQLYDSCPELAYYQIHLLGCWRTPLEVLMIAKAAAQGLIPEVRSCDSAIAYVYARKNLKFSDDDRPDNEPIDFMYGAIDNEMMLQFNLGAWADVGNPTENRFIQFM